MRKINFKTSARQRQATSSFGSVSRRKALKQCSLSQVKGYNPTAWFYSKDLRTQEGTPLTSFPARVSSSGTASGAFRPAWSDKGLLFGGAQSLNKFSGVDTAGYEAITIVVVSQESLPLTGGTLLDTYNPYWYAGNAALQSSTNTGEYFFGLGNNAGPVDGLLGITGPEPEGAVISAACCYNRSLTTDAMLYSKNGEQGEVTTNISSTYNPTFNSNALYLGSRGGGSIFFDGSMTSVIIVAQPMDQQEVNGISRMGYWSSK
jgi:hypothetical protein